MNKGDITAKAVTVEECSLGELQHWLQYAKHTWALGAGILWLSYGLILTGLKILAVVFTPYMLWHLFKAKWYKSVIMLFILVVLPYTVFKFVHPENSIFQFLCMVLPFLNFYIYTYILSYLIEEQLTKLKTLRRWKREETAAN